MCLLPFVSCDENIVNPMLISCLFAAAATSAAAAAADAAAAAAAAAADARDVGHEVPWRKRASGTAWGHGA
jgi:hypothetical protein